MDDTDQGQRRALLAEQVIDLTRGLVIADNHFLATPSGMLVIRHARLDAPFATNGVALLVDATRLLSDYATSGAPPLRDYVHVLMHCLLLHPFVGKDVDARAWDLACDIVAESLTAEICGPRAGERGGKIEAVLEQIADDLPGTLTAEKLYRHLRAESYRNMWESWEKLFRADDHSCWHPQSPSKDQAGRSEQADSPDTLSAQEREQARDRWARAAKSVRLDLQTLSRAQGKRLGALMQKLEVQSHDRVDFRTFLKQFAVRDEYLHVSEEEFDYVLYSFGFEHYGDMPLIEPLEYRDERRIRDFVIVLDTSTSVTNRTIQQFVDTTFDVLSSEASFFGKVNIHIVMCDAQVQSDMRLTSLSDLDRWRRNIKIRGFGGTDFRPAFRYVDELVTDGEFDDLSGLIYFTDGWGIYPDRAPFYKCAFVFYDEDHRPDLVPPWAIQLTLHPGEFETMSVY